MDTRLEKNALYDIVEPIVTGFSFRIVDLKSVRLRSGLQVTLTIYKPEGVSLQDCSDVSKVLLPRLELFSGNRDVHLEVSSPGITRVLKSVDEFAVFRGSSIRLLLKDASEWLEGRIVDTQDEKLSILTEGSDDPREIPYAQIQKARLAG